MRARRTALGAPRVAAALAGAVYIALSLLANWPILRRGLGAGGAFGPAYEDQTHYFAWVQGAGQNLLVSNEFDLPTSPHDLLHPVIGVSGLVHRITGLGVVESYTLWLPVVWALVIFAVWRYAGRFLAGWARASAMALALLWVPAGPAIADWLGSNDPDWLATGYDITSLTWTRGYLPGALAGALLPLALLLAERCRARPTPPRTLALGVLAALLGWVHPWQGVLLIAIIVAAEGAMAVRTGRAQPAMAVVVAAGLLPLAYWALLPRLDPFWVHARDAGRLSIGVVVLGLVIAPLALFAAPAYRRLPAVWGELALRAWPPIALVLVFVPGSSVTHFLLMLPLPLGILALRVMTTFPRRTVRAVSIAALVLLCVPGPIWLADRESSVDADTVDRLTSSQRAALDALAKEPDDGGVLVSSDVIGSMLPYRTGHPTYTGNSVFTPDATRRADTLRRLFGGTMPAAEVRELLRRTGARYLFADCTSATTQLERSLPRMTTRREWGCVRLYRVPV